MEFHKLMLNSSAVHVCAYGCVFVCVWREAFVKIEMIRMFLCRQDESIRCNGIEQKPSYGI